jgi:hypothetical protein
MTHSHVYFMSSSVSGSPSDHSRFGFSSRSTSKPVVGSGLGSASVGGHVDSESSSRTVSSLHFGSVAARSAFQCPSAVTTPSVRMVAANTWLLAKAFE